jgi:hypothetical protein
MAKAKRKRTNKAEAAANDAQAQARNRWFWESRERWLSPSHEDKLLGRTVPVPLPSRKLKPKKTPQADRVRQALRKLYPGGKVPDLGTAFIQVKVVEHLAAENKRLGLRLPAPSWPTIKRALRKLSSRAK